MSRLRNLFTRHWQRKLIVTIILLGGVYGYRQWTYEPPQEYLTASVVRGDLEQAVLATGTLQARYQVDVGAQASGQLRKLWVDAGSKVQQGQVLAEIDPQLVESDLKSALAQRDVLQAQLNSRQIGLQLARKELLRQQGLWQTEATARKELEAAEAQVRQGEADTEALKAQIRNAQINIDRNRTTLGYTRITAPISGEVVEIVTQQGQTVIASQQAPVILRLADLREMTVKAQVSEADVMRLTPGMPVYFTVLGAPQQRYWGKLRTVLPMPERINNAVFYRALFEVPNPEGKLKVDMTAEVNLLLASAKQVLNIPLSALGARNAKGLHAVKVLSAQHQVQTRWVRLGMQTNTRAQVLSGLKAGELVITGGGEGAASAAP
ncbi:macrolide transporter subunit MacA [Leeia aquatica]|uniref:Macrolide transporter subunit MacA n=1 Tax=Leeia aquatica TaxID=2725557 RepID=A0A847SJS4_9NEIS|nr:macrolide transporter subunit MacA [Leeia aquatica]NLR76162.1 macrolide transporter subunit MacA [Leeia aquatica]